MANTSKNPRIRRIGSDNKRAGKRISRARRTVFSPLSAAIKRIASFLMLEYHPIKLPQNKLGRFLTKRRSLMPKFLRGAFYEIRRTTWPNARETVRLTFAVFIFAIIFSVIVASLDFVLDKIFRSIILG